MNDFVKSQFRPGDIIYNFTQKQELGQDFELGRFVITTSIEDIKYCREFFIIKNQKDISLSNFSFIQQIDDFCIYKREQTHIVSYDIFDTLLARKCIFPEVIFDIVSTRLNLPNFKETRIKAERLSNGTFDDIYEKFKQMNSYSNEFVEKVKRLEIEVEKENIFPIVKNVTKLRETDILVSDMYLPKSIVCELLQQCGISTNNILYLSSAGKRTGVIWNQIKEKISYHIGDNKISDVVSPLHFGGIRGIHYSESLMNNFEQKYYQIGLKGLASLMRFVRLSNPYYEEPYTTLYNDQCNKNIPILVLYSMAIHNLCCAKGFKKILFTTRDCCLLSQVFVSLFNKNTYDYTVETFHSSRFVYENPSSDYIEYVKKTYTSDSLIIDFQGRGSSVCSFFKAHLNINPNTMYLLMFDKGNVNKCNFVIQALKGDNLENINYDVVGSLRDYQDGAPIRHELEYDEKYILPSHNAIKICCENFSQFDIPLLTDYTILQKLLDEATNILAVDILVNQYAVHKLYH